MVDSLSSANTIQNNQIQTCQKENLGKLVKYVNNQALKEVPDTFTSDVKGSLIFAGLFEGIPLIRLLKRNKKVYGKFLSKNMKSIDSVTKQTFKNISNGAGSFWEKASNFIKTGKKAKEAYTAEKTAVSKAIKVLSNEKALKSAKNATKIEKLTTEVKGLKEAAESTKNTALNAKNAITTIETATKNVKVLDKLKSGLKTSGAKGWFLFSLATEGLTEIYPTFKELGFKKGIKQLAKSAVKCAGDTFGFIAGEAIGTTLGTAIGTVLFPGVGTVVGAVCGFITGGLGSSLMGKITEKITGKSEREKAQEENEKQTVEQIANNQSAQTELVEATKAKIQEEAASNGGQLSEDSQLALEAINNLNQTNPFATAV